MRGTTRRPGGRSQGRRPTRESTLYRLGEWTDLQEVIDYLTESARALDPQMHPLDLASDVQAVVFHAQGPIDVADWCPDLSQTCGIDVRHTSGSSGAVLFLQVDEVLYAVTYGCGWTWIENSVKDERFGLSVVIRCLDSDEIVDVVRRSLRGKGRTDSTLVPDGIAVSVLRLDRQAELIKKLGGKSVELPTTFSGGSSASVTVQGSAGLRMRFGVEARDLIADIRAVASVLTKPVRDELAFVDHVVPVSSPATLAELDAKLDDLLGPASGPVPEVLSLAVPEACLDPWSRKQSVGLRVGGAAPRVTHDLALDELLRRTGLQSPGRRLTALEAGSVELFARSDGRESLGRSTASRWLQASVSINGHRFVRSEDHWYELDAGYLAKLRDDVTKILADCAGTITLPGWRRDPDGKYEDEKVYNDRVADGDRSYVRMDRRLIQLMPGRSSGIEMCDLLGPGDELIHVKRATGSDALSHLFTQAAVSEEALRSDAPVRKAFLARVQKEGRRVLPEDFVPTKVVFGILLKHGEELSADTLFPFAQVALRQAVNELRGRVAVEVVGIRVEQVAGGGDATTGPADAAPATRRRKGKVPVPGKPQ